MSQQRSHVTTRTTGFPLLVGVLCFFPLFLSFSGAPAAEKKFTRPSLRCELCMGFTLYRHGDDSPAVLVVGGIQGDEPGGFSAASLLATRYTIVKGALWIVPNLNFPSIVLNSRGLYGDMNRKFLRLDANDPEYTTVSRIQKLIRRPEVKLVLNLHDGSGYFRMKYEDAMHNPQRWGQSVIIDQSTLPAHLPHYNLEDTAKQACETVNARLLQTEHRYHIKNTKTAEKDREMEKTLSWYAVRHNKAAFGIEASKEFPVEVRVYYHLNVVESMLRQAGVEFTRNFDLTIPGVLAALQSDVRVAFMKNRVVLPLEDVRRRINFLPLPKKGKLHITTSTPILAVVHEGNKLSIRYGNRTLTQVQPDRRETDDGIRGVEVRADGIEHMVNFGEVLSVRDKFHVTPPPSYRVNAIGARPGGVKGGSLPDKSRLDIGYDDFMPRFSLDTRATLYRVEVYNGWRFAGMFLVRFDRGIPGPGRNILPSVDGPQSALGH